MLGGPVKMSLQVSPADDGHAEGEKRFVNVVADLPVDA